MLTAYSPGPDYPAHLPTPLEPLERLSEYLGGPEIWIKRDDCTGLAGGGNKTRKLEFLMGEALQQGADTIVIGASSQSNWCRQTTAAACKFGMDAELILAHGIKGAALQGNLLIDRLLGADVTIVEGEGFQQLPPLLEERVEKLKKEGRKPYLMNPFGLPTLSLSAVAYVNAVLELDAQLETNGKEADYIYLAGANITDVTKGVIVQIGLVGIGQRQAVIFPIVDTVFVEVEVGVADVTDTIAVAVELVGIGPEAVVVGVHHPISIRVDDLKGIGDRSAAGDGQRNDGNRPHTLQEREWAHLQPDRD